MPNWLLFWSGLSIDLTFELLRDSIAVVPVVQYHSVGTTPWFVRLFVSMSHQTIGTGAESTVTMMTVGIYGGEQSALTRHKVIHLHVST